ncbi:MAG TPA: hypothetical protein VLF39_03155 [Candidatus Saccharimonadales bacterium]|nr:hypothetical protein [Candidatus Saccharimonadales bacterium]
MSESDTSIEPHVLRRVALDNISDQQVGEINDGISHEQARDTGFGDAADFVESNMQIPSGERTEVSQAIETEAPAPALLPRSVVQPTRKLFELPGVGNGRTNFDQPVNNATRGLSDAEIERRKAATHEGFGQALDTLRSKKPL